ncbi:hypothetical protein MMC25_001941 [Agyrium rufum]|nr:hypothetical protein [Agyrium rufum]
MTRLTLPLSISIQSSERVWPDSHNQKSKETIVPLSLIDAAVANFSAAGAVWFFDGKTSTEGIALSPSTDMLKRSLTKTLDAYPQWAGTPRLMEYSEVEPEGGRTHHQRFGRLEVCFGSAADPGVEFVTATCPSKLADLILDRKERAAKQPVWGRCDLSSEAFASATPLAAPMVDDLGTNHASLSIQVTGFACGGFAVAAKSTHCLADAHSLVHIMNHWARINRTILLDEEAPKLNPVFQPSLLDGNVAGDINRPAVDPEILNRVRGLPLNRYDWWASANGLAASWDSTQIPQSLQSDPIAHDPAGDLMPWNEWDLTAPVSHHVLHFTKIQVERIWKIANVPNSPVSRHDAIVAHVWTCINRAKGTDTTQDCVHCDITLGLRGRTSIPLGNAFIGSPIMIATVEMTGKEASYSSDDETIPSKHTEKASPSIAKVAAAIHSKIKVFSSDVIAEYQHTLAYEISPQRIWQAFLGRKHTLVTSWVHTGLYDVDFGTGFARYVDSIVPDLDGCVQLMEAGPVNDLDQEGERAHWCDSGVDVSIHLEARAAERMIRDPWLFP